MIQAISWLVFIIVAVGVCGYFALEFPKKRQRVCAICATPVALDEYLCQLCDLSAWDGERL